MTDLRKHDEEIELIVVRLAANICGLAYSLQMTSVQLRLGDNERLLSVSQIQRRKTPMLYSESLNYSGVIMKLEDISDNELEVKIVELCKNERKALVELLYHLIEFDKRRAYLASGYSSLYSYCRGKLKFSEGGTHRRISACRVLRDNPEIAQLLIDGDLTLCSIAAAATALKDKTTEVKELIGKSRSEVEELVAPKVETKPKEVIRPIVVEAPAMPLVAAQPKEQRYELRFSVSKDVFESFNQARARLSNSLKAEQSVEAAFSKLVEIYLAPKARATKVAKKGRYVPRSLIRKLS